MSDNNVQFLSQANGSSCRDAVQANPLRNISDNLLEFSRNLGMNVFEISEEVRRESRESESIRLEAVEVSKPVINLAIKKGDRGTQTTMNPCMKCEAGEAKRFESKSCQVLIQNTLEATTQYEEEPGSFSVNLDARTLQTMTRDQQQVFVEFCRVFGLQQDRFGNAEAQPRWDQGNEVDRMSYANPENPNAGGNMFISFSPIRDRSRPRSPERRRITERLGEKIPSPTALYDDMMSPRFEPQVYRIPSPVVNRHDRMRERDRQSPNQSRGFRNRSRTRSSSPRDRRSRSKSPEIHPFAHRRGRY